MSDTVIYIMGVSGSGKSTVARLLSAKTGYPWFDGDDFHPAANIQKMESGQALNDQDRKGWLESINHHAREQQKGAIYACSALKESYREQLTQQLQNVHWVYLKGSFDVIEDRMKAREDHYMPVDLLRSQFDTLEEPSYGLHLDIRKSPEEIVESICNTLDL